jgi:Bacterial protein of unknown function (DUF885)
MLVFPERPVPGHHLQISQSLTEQENLNRWQRVMSWVSGYGEGWATYAERLMGELGYPDDDPGAYLGMLDIQMMAAATVTLDIWVHLELEIPKGESPDFLQVREADGETWTRTRQRARSTGYARLCRRPPKRRHHARSGGSGASFAYAFVAGSDAAERQGWRGPCGDLPASRGLLSCGSWPPAVTAPWSLPGRGCGVCHWPGVAWRTQAGIMRP